MKESIHLLAYKMRYLLPILGLITISLGCNRSIDSEHHKKDHSVLLSNRKLVVVGIKADKVTNLLGKPSFVSGHTSQTFAMFFTYPSGFRSLRGQEKKVVSLSEKTGNLEFLGTPFDYMNAPIFCVKVENDIVIDKRDSFGGSNESSFVTSGRPSLPLLLEDEIIVDSFPRYLDIRWIPSRGAYPITYEVELTIFYSNGSSHSTTKKTENSFFCTLLSGANKYELKVRAQNSEGVSDWSEVTKITSIR